MMTPLALVAPVAVVAMIPHQALVAAVVICDR